MSSLKSRLTLPLETLQIYCRFENVKLCNCLIKGQANVIFYQKTINIKTFITTRKKFCHSDIQLNCIPCASDDHFCEFRWQRDANSRYSYSSRSQQKLRALHWAQNTFISASLRYIKQLDFTNFKKRDIESQYETTSPQYKYEYFGTQSQCQSHTSNHTKSHMKCCSTQ